MQRRQRGRCRCKDDEVTVISSFEIVRKRNQLIAVNKAGHYKRVDNACNAARDRVPCTGNAQLYRVLCRTDDDAGTNAGAYRRCDNKPDAGLSGCREEVLRRTGVLTPAQSDDYVDRHKNDKGNNNQCVQAHLDVILLIYKICFPTLLAGNALEILWFIPPFLRSVKASL